MTGDRERLAEVMQAHSRDGRKSYLNVVCVCGWSGTFTDHYLHIADSLMAAGFRDVAEVAADAWDEGVEAYRSRYERDESLPLANPYRTTDTNGATK